MNSCVFRCDRLLALVLAATAAWPATAQDYVLTAKPVRRVEGVQTFDVKYPNFKASEWVAFAAAAPELPSQQDVSTRLSPSGKTTTEESDLKRPIVMVRVAAGEDQASHFRFTVTYQATLLERRLIPLAKGAKPPKVDPLTDAEKTWYLAPTKTFYDYEARPFQDWLDQHGVRKKGNEDEVAFARRVLLVIANTCTYEYRLDDDRHASAVCRAGKSDCGGLSVLFAAALRANGVPARSLLGHHAESAVPGAKIGDIPFTRQHTRAEFFAPGVGWVPVDPSVALSYKWNQAVMMYLCFGYDAGDFLVDQVDYDLVLDTGVYGKQTPPWVWCSAWPIGNGERTNPVLSDDWKVRPLPLR